MKYPDFSIFNFLFLFTLISGCASHPEYNITEVTVDERRSIIEAKKWEPSFIRNDTSSGIIIDYIKPKLKKSDIKVTFLRLYPYPLDTTTATKTHLEGLSVPAPAHSLINKTIIYYKFQDYPIQTSGLIDSTNQTTIMNIIPNQYLVFLYFVNYEPIWIKKPGIDSGLYS